MTNSFEKLLELGFKGTTSVSSEVTPKPTQTGPRKTGKATNAKAKRTAKRALKPVSSATKASKSKTKAKRPKRVHKSAPAFVTSLPKAHLLTANGFKKVSYAASAKKVVTPATKVKPKAKPAKLAVEATVAAQIRGLPDRTMVELQQQWLNVLSCMETRPESLQLWKKFHNALVAEWGRRHRLAISDPDYFIWPSTKVGPGDRSQSFSNWHSEGMLGYLGYRVGNANGATDFVRRKILDAVFLSVLPPINEASYVRDWGVEGTASRLKRVANEIARFAQNGKRKRSADMSSAVSDWEADLRYLYREYYVGKFGFGWPQVS